MSLEVPAHTLPDCNWRGNGTLPSFLRLHSIPLPMPLMRHLNKFNIPTQTPEGHPLSLIPIEPMTNGSSCALAFLTPSPTNTSLYSFQDSCPCFHCLRICFLLFSFLPSLHDFLCSVESIIKDLPAQLCSFSLKASS